jgi:hypothetical protein
MSYDLNDKLVIAITSRALFDLEYENTIYNEKGLEEYTKYQVEHENDILKSGTAFSLVKALLNLNDKFNAHIFFDDQDTHVKPASSEIPSGRVPYKTDSDMNDK